MRLKLALAALVAAAAVVVGCEDYDYDNSDQFYVKDGHLCDVVTDECEVLP